MSELGPTLLAERFERCPAALRGLEVPLTDQEVLPNLRNGWVGADVIGPSLRRFALCLHLLGRQVLVGLDLDDPVDVRLVAGDEVGVVLASLRPQDREVSSL